MQIKANFVSSRVIESQGRKLNLNTCISEGLGSFSFFSNQSLNFDYLKPITLEFDLTVYQSRLMLRFIGAK